MPTIVILLLSLCAPLHSQSQAYPYTGGTIPHGAQAYLMNSGERIIVPPGSEVPADIHWKPGAPRNARRIYLGEDPKTIPPNTCLFSDQAMMKQRGPAPSNGAKPRLRSAVYSPTGESVKAQGRTLQPQVAWAVSSLLDFYLAQTASAAAQAPHPTKATAFAPLDDNAASDAHDRAVQAALQSAAAKRTTTTR